MNQFETKTQRGRGGKRPWNANTGNGNFSFSLDCFCIYCGTRIVNQALKKPVICPNPICKMPLSGRTAPSTRAGGWIRCMACDMFMHPTHHFCSNCREEGTDGKANFVAARGQLMSKNPNAVVARTNISLAELGGIELLGTLKKKSKK